MSKYEESDSREHKSSGPHADYGYNLRVARTFIERVTPHLLAGMNICITGSHGLEESLLMISWNPGRYAKMGTFANPIFLHQSKDSFAKSMEWTFNDYLARAKKYANIAKNEPIE